MDVQGRGVMDQNSQSNGDKTIDELNAVIETHLDAVKILQDAVEGLRSPEYQSDARQMLQEHQDAATRLQQRVSMLGGQPAQTAHKSTELTESWQEIWEAGEDQESLLALRANERVMVDGYMVNLGKENLLQTMSEEGIAAHREALEADLRHFQTLTDRLRDLGVAVDNDEVMGAVRNAAEHLHAAINLSGTAVEAFVKWATAKTD